MKRIFSLLFTICFLYLAYGLYASLWLPHFYSLTITNPSNHHFYDYSGVINVRTNKSSGSGSIDEILVAANNNHLNFIVFTDTNDFSPDLTRQTNINDIVVFVGGEYSYLDARLLNFGFTKSDHLQGPGRSQIAFADLLSRSNRKREEGLFFLSHPLKQGYQIRGPIPPGIDGIELLNLKSVWQDNWLDSKTYLLWTLLLYPFNSNLAYLRLLLNAGENEIAFWDKLNLTQPTLGYYGSSAEAKIILSKHSFIKFPSYETLFSIAKNHLLIRSELTGNPTQDRKKIYDALVGGHYYMSLDLLQNPAGFESYVKTADGTLLPIGSTAKFTPGDELVISLADKPNLPFETIIYKDGERVVSSNSAKTTFALFGPGQYRSLVKVRIPLPWPYRSRWINWIVTNPIYLK